MSDLSVFDGRSPEAIAVRSAEFIRRCDIILASVFQKKMDVRQAFGAWIATLFHESENPVWLLHEHPLHVVAEYLGMDAATIEQNDPIAAEYTKLSQKLNW